MTAPIDGSTWNPLISEAFSESDDNTGSDDPDSHAPFLRIDKEAPGYRLKPRCHRRGHAGHRN